MLALFQTAHQGLFASGHLAFHALDLTLLPPADDVHVARGDLATVAQLGQLLDAVAGKVLLGRWIGDRLCRLRPAAPRRCRCSPLRRDTALERAERLATVLLRNDGLALVVGEPLATLIELAIDKLLVAALGADAVQCTAAIDPLFHLSFGQLGHLSLLRFLWL